MGYWWHIKFQGFCSVERILSNTLVQSFRYRNPLSFHLHQTTKWKGNIFLLVCRIIIEIKESFILIVSCISLCPSRSRHHNGIRYVRCFGGQSKGKGTVFRLRCRHGTSGRETEGRRIGVGSLWLQHSFKKGLAGLTGSPKSMSPVGRVTHLAELLPAPTMVCCCLGAVTGSMTLLKRWWVQRDSS